MLKQSTEMVTENVEVCSSFRKSSIDELKEILKREGWIYCISCRKVILSEEELENHLKEHIVVSGIVMDEAIAEEAPTAD